MEVLSDAKRRLLERLKRLGPITVGSLARDLGLTDMAVRQHLQVLEGHGLIRSEKQKPKGRGRPSVRWSLTPLAAEIFPDRHGDLTLGLLDATREAFGEEGLDRILDLRAREQLDDYRQRLPPTTAPLGERVEALAQQRSVEGYMAEALDDGEGGWTLVEHHCPICVAAQRCAGLCRTELEVFRKTLGDDVRVERTRHLLQDDDRCAYSIRPVAPTGDQ